MIEAERVEALLAQIAPDSPAGASLRYEMVYTNIRLAREEDDPTLPMGLWERPLKTADWPAISAQCETLLTNKSKDLQIAAWLVEAWLKQHELRGLAGGMRLLLGLIRHYWEHLHPEVDADGDLGPRLAALEWLSQELPLWIKLHVTLVELRDRKPARLNLAEWEQMTAAEMGAAGREGATKPGSEDASGPLTRDWVIAYARAGHQPMLTQVHLESQECAELLAALREELVARVGDEAPVFNKAVATLDRLSRACVQLLPEPTPSDGQLDQQGAVTSMDLTDITGDADTMATESDMAAAPPPVALTAWKTREEAYRTLEAIADYLSATEPHSPTPYLIRRAVTWGRMPLPELFAEIIREEGDLNRMTKLLGIG